MPSWRLIVATACIAVAMLVGWIWFWWSTDASDQTPFAQSSGSLAPPASPDTLEQVPLPVRTEARGVTVIAESLLPQRVSSNAEKWSKTKRHCPWPPRSDTWRDLDAECTATLDHFLEEDGYHYLEMAGAIGSFDGQLLSAALEDPLSLRNTVVAALDDSECRIPEGELRADLMDTCGAAKMVQLAVLVRWCGWILGGEDVLELEMEARRDEIAASASQEEYDDLMEYTFAFDAARYWGRHVCRSVPSEVLEPLDQLPMPKIRGLGQQSNALFASARRLGCQREPGSSLACR